MTTLTELIHRYDESEELEDEDRIYEQLREFAIQNRADFLKEFRSLPLDEDSPASWIYEALSEVSEQWREFFLEEFDRIVASVSADPEPDSILPLLNDFYLFGLDEDDSLRQPLRKKICRGLSHPHPAVRRGCVTLLVDFVKSNDMKELTTLAHVAQSDDEWRVRYTAYRALEEVWPSKAKKIKLPLWIRTKGRIAKLETIV